MPGTPRRDLNTALPFILQTLTIPDRPALSPTDLQQILSTSRKSWRLKSGITVDQIKQFLLTTKSIYEFKFKSGVLRPLKRYSVKKPTPYQLALSLKPNSYLCHGTAAFLHGLIPELPNTVYVNREQTEKEHHSSLNQTDLTRAFQRTQRVTRGIYACESWKYVLINGKYTNRRGVETILGPERETLDATNIERTLIDITVRPAYAGGILNVLNAYELAKAKLSVDGVIGTLKRLRHLYPFHQAIGYYMQRAGYHRDDYEKLKSLGLKFDFYLAHATQPHNYVAEWKLFIPKDF